MSWLAVGRLLAKPPAERKEPKSYPKPCFLFLAWEYLLTPQQCDDKGWMFCQMLYDETIRSAIIGVEERRFEKNAFCFVLSNFC
jgi:hypothetical protein